MMMSKFEECPSCGAGSETGDGRFHYDLQTCHACDWSFMTDNSQAGRDAQRYRWLVENAFIGAYRTGGGERLEIVDTDRRVPYCHDYYRDDIGAAIDAAMAEESAERRRRKPGPQEADDATA